MQTFVWVKTSDPTLFQDGLHPSPVPVGSDSVELRGVQKRTHAGAAELHKSSTADHCKYFWSALGFSAVRTLLTRLSLICSTVQINGHRVQKKREIIECIGHSDSEVLLGTTRKKQVKCVLIE